MPVSSFELPVSSFQSCALQYRLRFPRQPRAPTQVSLQPVPTWIAKDAPMPANCSFAFDRELTPFIEELFRKAAAPSEWDLTLADFTMVLARSAQHHFRDAGASVEDVRKYLDGLHVADLALACSCRSGKPAAWEHFVARFRPELYRAARAIAGDARGRELADSLYAELYGLEAREGKRRSLFDYFHGRSKLATWLRAILAQRHVDEWRRSKKTESLDDDESAQAIANKPRSSAANPMPDPDRERYLVLLQAAMKDALASLDPRERLRLACYYVDGLTLAQIGRLLGEHEATVSRKLERVRRDLRRQIDAALREKKSLSEAQVQLCYQYASEEWPFDLTGALSARE
jgi:RNA polymerase sigma-70 factor, ECF subfamily